MSSKCLTSKINETKQQDDDSNGMIIITLIQLCNSYDESKVAIAT